MTSPTPALTAPASSPTRGIVLMLLTMVVFSAQDGISRLLAADYPPVFIVTIRYWAFALFVIAISSIQRGGLRAAVRTSRPITQLCRGLLLAIQICFVTFSFHQLGLSATHAIMAITPLMVVAAGALVLREQVAPLQWAAVAVGFVGVLILVAPDGGVFDLYAIIPLGCAVGFATYQILTRWVGRTDAPQTSFFYTGIGGALGMTIIGPFFWTEMAPADWIWMAALCLSGATGHFLLIKAYEATEASRLQPFAYLQLVLTSIMGVLVFSEVLTANLLIGAAITVGAGLLAWQIQRR